jgi:quercetin dioxygenase-like cupin family protein
MNPYSDNKQIQGLERTFFQSVDSHELVWHQDHCHRLVTVVEGNGWQLQMDNCMPCNLKPGDVVRIPRDTFHRLLKGSGDLKLLIVED